MKLKVSAETYNEIFAALEKEGRQPGVNVKEITLELSELERPVDYRLATIRKDCADIIAKVWSPNDNDTYIKNVRMLYNYVLLDKLPNEEYDGK